VTFLISISEEDLIWKPSLTNGTWERRFCTKVDKRDIIGHVGNLPWNITVHMLEVYHGYNSWWYEKALFWLQNFCPSDLEPTRRQMIQKVMWILSFLMAHLLMFSYMEIWHLVHCIEVLSSRITCLHFCSGKFVGESCWTDSGCRSSCAADKPDSLNVCFSWK